MKVEGAALRAPRGQMLGGEPQVMSVHIVEASQQRRTHSVGVTEHDKRSLPTWPRAAATRRELSRATSAGPTCQMDTALNIAHAQPQGSCWARTLPAWRRLHGPDCARSLRCSSSTVRTGNAFVVAPCARITIPMRATPSTFTTGSYVKLRSTRLKNSAAKSSISAAMLLIPWVSWL